MEYIFWYYFQIRKYQCVWDRNSSIYKDRNVRLNAWNELSDNFKQGKYSKRNICV